MIRNKRKRKTKLILTIFLIVAALATAAVLLIFNPFDQTQQDGVDDILSTPAQTIPPPSPTPPNITPSPTPEPQLLRSLYEVLLDIDPTAMTVHGRMRMNYLYSGDKPICTLALNLFPNAVASGCMRIDTITLSGADVYYQLSDDGAQLTVPLDRDLSAGDSVTLFIDYTIDIPKTGNRFGYGENGILLGNALPIAAMQDDNGTWRKDKYSDRGDSFYSEIADYKVVVTLPHGYTLASTGSVTEQQTHNDLIQYYIFAPQVREFALSAHKDASVATLMSGDIEILCVARNSAEAEFGATTAKYALELFSSTIGVYPYKRLCVVQFDSGGGMEYPGLIMVDKQLFDNDSQRTGSFVIAHETAHQWWYAVVGSDQIRSPWLDESLTEFMGLEFYRLLGGRELYLSVCQNEFAPLSGYKRTARLDLALPYFADDEEYATVVYRYGAKLYSDLFDKLGENAFYDALATYYNAHRFGIATAQDLIGAFSDAYGSDLTEWFETRLEAPYQVNTQ
ncbi:MAG: M1 family metallopeptidase [Clostridia bacterium]